MSYLPKQISTESASDINSATNISGTNWVTNTYTGQWELNDYAYVGVNLQVDEAGTLFFDFSQDGTNFSSYPVAGVAIASGINEVHTAWKGGRYFRVRFVGTGGRSFFRLKTFFSHHSLPLSAPLNQGISSDQDATVVRSVSIGEDPAGSYINQKADGQGYITTTNLAASGQYDTGVLDLQGYTQVQTHIVSDVDGTITVEFCSDSGGTVVRTLTIPYSAAGGFQMFSAPAFTPYVRYIYDNGGTIQTSFFFETKFLTKSLSGQLLGMDSFISPSMVANLGRNVIVGQDSAGKFRNVPTDSEGHLKINIHDPVSAFGDLRVTELTPKIHLTFPYNINTDIVNPVVAGTATQGSVTQSDSMAVLNTSTATDGAAEFSSRRVLTYRSGLGGMVRFTALFTTGVASSEQRIGIGDDEDGFFFGYNGTAFGILRIQDSTSTWYPQTTWNVDTMDGNGPSAMILDQTNINVFQIQYQWLGAGQIEFSIEDEETGLLIPVHRIKYANNFTIPSIYNANLPLSAKVINSGNTSDLTLKTASMAAFVEGKSEALGPINSHSETKSVNTEESLFHIRNKTTFNGKTNRVRMILKQISVGNDANQLCTVKIYSGATLGAETAVFTDINGANSVAEVDTVKSYVSGGRILWQGVIGKDTGESFDLSDLDIQIIPGELITITAEQGGAAADESIVLTWQEDF